VGVELGWAVNPRHQEAAFSTLQKLSFFRWDLFIALIAIPLVLLLMTRLPLRFTAPSILALGSSLVFWLTVQRASSLWTGRFLSLPFVLDGLVWASRHPADLKAYAPVSTVLKMFLAVMAPAVLAAGLYVYWRRRSVERRPVRPSRLAVGICFAIILAPSLLSFGPWMPSTMYHKGALELIFWLNTGEAGSNRGDAYSSMSSSELVSSFAAISHEPDQPMTAPSPYSGKARGYDVIVWVAETLPSKVAERRPGGIAGFPNLSTLANSSLVLDRHYTSAPYSSLAVFSILAGLYPPPAIGLALDKGRLHGHVPGMLSAMNRLGYETAAFLPGDASFDSDLAILGAMSPRRIFISAQEQTAYENVSWKRRLDLDQVAFREMKRSIGEWTSHDKHYCAVFCPEIGHAPWADVTGLGSSASTLALGEALFALQDRWIGELLQLLNERRRLDRTLILVTGDHGIRTRVEDPQLRLGVLQDYTFHVPLMLYAPGVFKAPRHVDTATSHIDIAPSLLDLLADRYDPKSFEGVPFWSPEAARRRIFFLGSSTVGSAGYYEAGTYYSIQCLSHTVLSSPDLNFDHGQVIRDRAKYEEVNDLMSSLDRLELAMLRKLAE